MLKMLIYSIFYCLAGIDPRYATPLVRHVPANETVNLLCYVRQLTNMVILSYSPQVWVKSELDWTVFI